MNSRTETQILLDMLETVKNNHLISLDDETIARLQNGELLENQYILDLNTHAVQLAQLEEQIQEIDDNTYLTTAKGEGLDRLGDLVNVQRYPATSSFVDIKVTLPTPNENNIEIPAGTQLQILDIYDNGSEYQTVEQTIITAGVMETTIRCESIDKGTHTRLPEQSVTGLRGFDDLIVTNPMESTRGQDIEDDESYRQRIRNWSAKNQKGTRACIEDYLLHYPGVDEFYLEPCVLGPGTLRIVVDALYTDLVQIQADVEENCMFLTDDPVDITVFNRNVLNTLTLEIHPHYELVNQTYDELTQEIISHVNIFIDGGVTRNQHTIKRLGIGQDFEPVQLYTFLVNEFPEIGNLVGSITEIIEIDPQNRFGIDEVVVEYV